MTGNHMAKHLDELKTRKKTSPKSEGRELAKDEPQPISVVDCPPELGPVARQEWDRLAGALTALGRLTIFDRATLAAYCNAYALWLEAVDALQKYGSVMKSPSGYPVQSMYLSIVNKQVEIMVRIATEFGFTPASRRRLPTPSKGDDAWLELQPLDGSDLEPW
jgi:P27 family predicted phage terminase small subunit